MEWLARLRIHGIWAAAQAELAKLRSEALTTPFLKRLLSLKAFAVEGEKRIESEGFRICDGQTWTLHNDGVCQSLWFRGVKAEKRWRRSNSTAQSARCHSA
jgi:hypothetical protein